MSKLYVIGTPIGNLGDITLRAIETLKSVDVVLCEDTRVTQKLLNHYEIKKKTLSYHSQSGMAKLDKILELLKENDLALVSDAGTPTISDPGSILVDAVRKEGVEVITIPGPSAVVSALSISGLPSSEFVFLGFLPHKKGRQTLFKEIKEMKRTVVFYESPHRIIKTLESLKDVGKEVVVAKELTKIHEEVISGSAEEILEYFESNKDKIRGEFVVMVGKK